MKYLIQDKADRSDLVNKVRDVSILSIDELNKSDITFTSNDQVLSPSENALDLVIQRTEDQVLSKKITQLKDKVQFRNLMSSLFPEFRFAQVSLREISALTLEPGKRFIIKPVKGFFGVGVHAIDSKTDLVSLQKELESSMKERGAYFSSTVLSKEEFIVEEFIEGEEFAVDMYYNHLGQPVIVNLTHHPLPDKQEYFHSLYYNGEDIFERYYQWMMEFFIRLNHTMKFQNFAIHAEFKGDDKLIPIEMNPMRFGGFGLADLCYYSTGENPYALFFENRQIEWSELWDQHDARYAWALGYNGSDVDLSLKTPNHEAFKDHLGEVLHYISVDHHKNPVFSKAYIKVGKEECLDRLVNTEFNRFFV